MFTARLSVFLLGFRRRIIVSIFIVIQLATVEGENVSTQPSEDSYALVHRDVISVNIFDEPDLTTKTPINAQGNIKLPLIGIVQVAGMIIYDAERKLEQAYIDGEFLREPQINIVVEVYTPRVVSVLGQVNNPGKFQLPDQITEIDIVELIGEAGGFKGIAQTADVRVTRTLKDGTTKVFKIDMKEMIEGGRKSDNKEKHFLVYPGDVIFVPERFF